MQKIFFYLITLFLAAPIFLQTVNAEGFELKVNSVRLTFSKPETFHSLVYSQADTRVNFELEPVNNELVGFFVDLNGIEIGYATDFINNRTETKTQDFIFSYKGFKHSKITFNYQKLEGLKTNALNISNESQRDIEFLSGSDSTKFELFGAHDLYTFFGESLFDHFFLNKPQQSNSNNIGLSLGAGWSYKNLSLESDESLLFQPDFIDSDTTTVQTLPEVDAQSFGVSIGPLLSISLKNNIHLFAEVKAGKGYFRNDNRESPVKRSRNENIFSVGGGISWTAPSNKTVFLLRGKTKKAEHVETFFGDLSIVHYF